MKKIICAVLCLMLLCSCGSFADKDSVMDLLSSPRLAAEESRIISAISDTHGREIVLKYPKAGDYRLPIYIYDFNSDGVKEAVVFYGTKSLSSNVRIAILQDGGDDGWQVIYDKEGYGSEIDKISYTKLFVADNVQVLVGYTFSDFSEIILTTYIVRNDSEITESSIICQEYIVYDVTGDGIDDVIYADTQKSPFTAIHIASGADYSAITNIATQYLNVRNGIVTKMSISKNEFSSNSAVVIDLHDANYKVYTYAMYCEENEIHTRIDIDTVQKIWDYSYNINSMDVDNDGYFETPTVIKSNMSSNSDLKFMEWTCFLKEQPVRKYYGVCNAATGVFFALPSEWQDAVSLSFDEEDINKWYVDTVEGEHLVTFEILTENDTQQSDWDVIVKKGVVQIGMKFGTSLSGYQKQYISSRMIYIE